MSHKLNKLEQLFHAALELRSTQERADYLAQACGPDSSLRQRIEKLLHAHETAGLFLDPEGPALQTGLPFYEPDLPPAEKPGDQIGRYRLVERIGEGACCVVYLAEQREPVRRHVALKLIKAGMDTQQVVARFEAERQALALMDHPHIAKVFDAGVTATDRPYVVMELVRGIPITQYCDQHGLTVKQRLELFREVCRAVQHAHQKGIIHRDLKPSNILVATSSSESPLTPPAAVGESQSSPRPATLSPAPSPTAEGPKPEKQASASRPARRGRNPSSAAHGLPCPKIIDFGIAKAMQMPLTDQAVVTWVGQFVGTPAYMSPEQVGMRSEDIDARADIHSLGTLLYELLTGVTPFDPETMTTASWDQMWRMIQETEPPTPSARLQGLGPKLAAVAKRRQVEPGALRRLLRGDLDWIVMKALEKDRQRRYATAHEFAEDIQRHLLHEPVQAGPPSAMYRARKFVRRHRVTVAVGVAVTVALVAGLSLALVGLQRALQAESLAHQERDRALQAEADARRMLELFNDKLVADDEMIGLLHSAARLAHERLGPTNPAALSFVVPLAPNLGRVGAWTNALEVYGWLVESDPGNSVFWERAHAAALAAVQPEAACQLRLGMVWRFAASQDPDDCLRLARALLIAPDSQTDLETAVACAHRAVQARPGDASCQIAMGMAEYRLSHWSQAMKWLQEAECIEDDNIAALAYCFGAMARQRLGRTSDAREALSRGSRQLLVPLEMGQLLAKNWQEVVFGFVARAEAERLILGRELSSPVTAESLAQARERWKSLHEPLVRGEAFAQQGKWRESRDAYVQALDHPSFDWGVAEEDSPMRCLSLHMAIAFVRTGDTINHERLCRLLLDQHPENPTTPRAERDATARADRFAKACFLYGRNLSPELRQEALKLARFAVANQQARNDHHAGWTHQTGGMAEYYAGEPERAVALLQEAEKGKGIFVPGIAMVFRAMALQKLNRAPEAVQVLHDAENLLANSPQISSGLYWWDAEQYKLALEEARQLIHPGSK